MTQKLTLTDLIKKKDEIIRKDKKRKELHLEQLNATITIEEPDDALVMDSVDLAQDENFSGNGDDYLVYNMVIEPNLKDPELQKIYECNEPTEIVSKIFDRGTIKGIAEAGMELAGYTSKVTPVDKLKN